jgi:hypothetical protein
MRPYEFPTFAAACEQLSYRLRYKSHVVHSARWQGADIASRPEMATHELTHTAFCVPLPHEDRDRYAADIRPNMPWAEDHFRERICGQPINPVRSGRIGPTTSQPQRSSTVEECLTTTIWNGIGPSMQAYSTFPPSTAQDWETVAQDVWGRKQPPTIHHGIMYDYGDLGDVVKLLCDDPYTRQAYLPVWFPEDTGGGSKRAPCTIGYHFLMRDGRLDVFYHIRSCDFVRHFRDDLYLTVRLLMWVLESCRLCSRDWNDVVPGLFVMQIGSLHLFRNDYHMLYGSK